MQRSFHLFVQRHANDWVTASVLTHPKYAAYGPKLGPLREEIGEVLSDELASGALRVHGETWFDKLQQRVLQLDLRAVQHDRLIVVPMRFTLLQRPLGAEDHFEISLPRLGRTFQIFGEENIIPWAEEVVRGFFHLDGVERLLAYQYERGARMERLDVVYHGSKKLKSARITRDFSPASDFFSPYHSPLGQVGVELVEEARRGRLAKVHFREPLVEEIRKLREADRPYGDAIQVRQEQFTRFTAQRLYYRGYHTKAGAIVLGALTRANRKAIRSILGIQDPTDDEDFDTTSETWPAEFEVWQRRVQQRLLEQSAAEWVARFDRAGVPASVVHFAEEMSDDPQVEAMGMMVELDHPVTGPQRVVGPILRMSKTRPNAHRHAPVFGADSAEVLREAGLEDDEIAALRAEGVIGGAE